MGVCWPLIPFFSDSYVPEESAEQSQVEEMWPCGDLASGFKGKNVVKRVDGEK